MKKIFVNTLEGLDYANLTDEQKSELRNIENNFNNENNTSYYFMIMKQD